MQENLPWPCLGAKAYEDVEDLSLRKKKAEN
jgi:hypothetical protein